MMNIKLFETINELIDREIKTERITLLQPLVQYMRSSIVRNETPQLNFICTHNARRSQMAQAWSFAAAAFYAVSVDCFSGGTEVTEFHESAVQALRNMGFDLQKGTGVNPPYQLKINSESTALTMFSKCYNHPFNPVDDFAAIMTCAEADENCPHIPGRVFRYSLPYQDPKLYDDSSDAIQKYNERCEQIGTEILYIFSQINK